MNNKVEIYDADNRFLMEGRYGADLFNLARYVYPNRQLVGVGIRANGTSYGFIISKSPAALGM